MSRHWGMRTPIWRSVIIVQQEVAALERLRRRLRGGLMRRALRALMLLAPVENDAAIVAEIALLRADIIEMRWEYALAMPIS
jgi:hypothetical protein